MSSIVCGIAIGVVIGLYVSDRSDTTKKIIKYDGKNLEDSNDNILKFSDDIVITAGVVYTENDDDEKVIRKNEVRLTPSTPFNPTNLMYDFFRNCKLATDDLPKENKTYTITAPYVYRGKVSASKVVMQELKNDITFSTALAFFVIGWLGILSRLN